MNGGIRDRDSPGSAHREKPGESPQVFYEQGEGRASKVDELFSTIARRYDLINDLQSLGLHRAWKQRVLGLAGARSGLRALDVCCGTGDLAIGFAQRGAE